VDSEKVTEKQEAWQYAGLAAWARLQAMGCVRSTRTVKGGVCPFGLCPLRDREQTAPDAECDRPERSFGGEPGVLRKLTLNLTRMEPAEKYRKQLYASCEYDFLLTILLNL
jgi:hypothetical protein